MAEELKDPTLAQPVAIGVARPAEIKQAGDVARSFAHALGFGPTECEEIALAVTELASNLVRHASGGTITLSQVGDAGRRGMQIESEDSGPGIADVEQAVTDGYSTAGGLGIGLGVINRLLDDLEFYSRPQTGLRIVCRRWLRPQARAISANGLAFGAAMRAYHMLPENGDAFIIRQWEGHALVGVIDGLGHGQFAQRASQTARRYIEQHFDQPLDSIFRGVGRACRATRGVVMALARFDLARQKLVAASIGNVEMRLIGSPGRFNFIVRRGVLGLNAPNPVCTEHPWTPTSLLILHSDGLRTHWDWDEFRNLAQDPPDVIAQGLLRALGKIEDDATVVVVKNATA
jgi:anti-sigma regulatory factor (Ser/Thr protein kinase)